MAKDRASKERLTKLEKELASLKEKSGGMKAEWQKEKSEIDAQAKVEEELETARRMGGAHLGYFPVATMPGIASPATTALARP